MNKKGQILSIIMFFGIVLAVFVISIILLKAVNTVLTPFSSSIGNVSVSAGQTVASIQSSFVKWWDIAILLIFFLNVIILLVSAFMIDVHPAFLILYILAVFFMIIFGSSIIGIVDRLFNGGIYGINSFDMESGQMPLVKFIVDNFGIVMLGIIIISGIITFAKLKYSSNLGGNY